MDGNIQTTSFFLSSFLLKTVRHQKSHKTCSYFLKFSFKSKSKMWVEVYTLPTVLNVFSLFVSQIYDSVGGWGMGIQPEYYFYHRYFRSKNSIFAFLSHILSPFGSIIQPLWSISNLNKQKNIIFSPFRKKCPGKAQQTFR